MGAGCGAPDLITVRGKNYLEQAQVIIYARSLINPQLLGYAAPDCELHNSAFMTLEEVLLVMERACAEGKTVVRLHTGEPSLYGAVREQMDVLDQNGIPYDSCPGVSACFGAASSMNLEYTLPGISQTLIITRIAGRTGVPEKEKLSELVYAMVRQVRGAGSARELDEAEAAYSEYLENARRMRNEILSYYTAK